MRKILRDKKAISTILAALLMVVIVVVASVMVYAWSTGLLGTLLVTPTAGKEALNQDAPATFASNNLNVSIPIRNTGSVQTTFTTYYIKDSSGNTYTQSAWTWGPSITPNQVGIANLGITAGGAGWSGTPFQFTSGYSYTVTVVTSRNNQFVFTVQR